MGSISHFCRHCDQLIPPDSETCPLCGKVNPMQARCPKCRAPIRRGWQSCSRCGLTLSVTCPECFKLSFFDDYCEHCQAHLVIHCPNPKCRHEQPPVGDICRKCGKPLDPTIKH